MKNTPEKLSARLRFPEDEKTLPWLPLILDAFAVIDKGGWMISISGKRPHTEANSSFKGCSLLSS
ncbi:MAG: hypothetical protein A2Z82_06455 [Nitrospirae bacterium GWA2_46_11]|nr:MAG: hypothetical protein A2Z82_06455 [Nitrospirae bacterium GWA2_46_11]